MHSEVNMIIFFWHQWCPSSHNALNFFKILICKITLLHLSGKWSPGWNSAAVGLSTAPFPSDLWQDDEEEVGSQMLRSRKQFPGLVLSRGTGTDISPAKIVIISPSSLAGEWCDIGLAHRIGSGWSPGTSTAQAGGGTKGVCHGWAWQQLCVAVSWCCPAELMWKAGMDLVGVRGKKMSPLFALMGSKLNSQMDVNGTQQRLVSVWYWCESGWCLVQEWWTAIKKDQKKMVTTYCRFLTHCCVFCLNYLGKEGQNPMKTELNKLNTLWNP